MIWSSEILSKNMLICNNYTNPNSSVKVLRLSKFKLIIHGDLGIPQKYLSNKYLSDIITGTGSLVRFVILLCTIYLVRCWDDKRIDLQIFYNIEISSESWWRNDLYHHGQNMKYFVFAYLPEVWQDTITNQIHFDCQSCKIYHKYKVGGQDRSWLNYWQY